MGFMRLFRATVRGERAVAMLAAPLTIAPGRGERVYVTSAARTLPGSAAVIWAILSDTNRWDRALGLPPSRYHYKEIAPGVRARIGQTSIARVFLRWLEVGEWIEGRSMWGERRFLTGAIPRAGYRFEIEQREDGAHVSAQAYAGAEDFFGKIFALLWWLRFKLLLPRYLASLAALLAAPPKRVIPGPPPVAAEKEEDVPPSLRARQLMLDRAVSRELSGPTPPVFEEAFRRAKARLEDLGVATSFVTRMCAMVQSRPDDELALIRPFDLAAAWGEDRRETLRAFLHACRAGLFDLVWQLNCPRCRVSAGHAPALSNVGRRVHCEDCNIGFDVDFAHNVEAAFQVSASVRRVDSSVYCGGSPWFRPHVFALLASQPGTREIACTLPRGELAVRLLGRDATRGVMVSGREPRRLELTVTAGRPMARVVAAEGPSDVIAIEHRNQRPAAVLVERAGWDAEIVRGSVMLTMPEFLDSFATEAPAAGDEVSIGALTVLFSDLTGSTALYERLGDARAFAIVQQHFRDLAAIIDEHHGAVLKTMGDAVMASFRTPAAALEAAAAMVRRAEEEGIEHGIEAFAVKIGLCEGPCMMVRANGRLDLFGSTVNLAARMQSNARPGQVVMLESAWQAIDPKPNLPVGFKTSRFRAMLRGLSAERKLVAIDPTRRASSFPRALSSRPPRKADA
jgi:adenylate cyclase